MQFRVLMLMVSIIFLLPGEAAAHVDVVGGSSGLNGGIMHPFSGIDHMLAMVAVGIWAGLLGGRFRWMIPACFVTAAAIGFLFGVGGSEAFGLIEQGVSLSLVGLGALLFFRAQLTLSIGLPLIATFGMFHGLAHGSEVAVGLGQWHFMVGFLVSTSLLHLTGVLAGMVQTKAITLRVGGAVIASVGFLMSVASIS